MSAERHRSTSLRAIISAAIALAGCPSQPPAPRADVAPRATPLADSALVLDSALDASPDALDALDASPDALDAATDSADGADASDSSPSQIVDGGFVYDGAFHSLHISERARRAEVIPERLDDSDPTFSDRESLALLARNPLWRAEQPGRTRAEDPMRCHFGTSYQSCVAEPCHETVGESCRAECGNTCISCDNECRPGCFACNAECTTDACRARCARTCGRCLDRCRTNRDRCVSGECGRREQACFRQFGRDFVRQCLPTCRRCYQQCDSEEEAMQCTVRCVRNSPRCNGVQFRWCIMTGALDPNRTSDE